MKTESTASKTNLKGSDDFVALLEQSYQTGSDFAREGDIVKGKVISIVNDFAIIDFGHKSEGQVPLHEFRGPNGTLTIKVGDEIEAYLETMEGDDGLSLLSKEKADALKIWDKLQEVVDQDSMIEGTVVCKVKGGLSVDIGVKAFLPASQIDVRVPSSLDKLIGRKFKFKILKLNKRKGNIIVSRRALMEKDRDGARHDLLQNLAEGQVVSGTIKNITDYGAFIDLGGVDGLLHVTDMSWGRVGHPSEILSVSQDVNVKVLKIDQESGKISLGLKQLTNDPWEKVAATYPVGTRIKGKVSSLADYGAFIELAQGIEGLVHVSEMSWSRKVKHPSKIVSVGDLVEAVVLDVDPNSRRISLGIKQVNRNPWELVAEKYPVGTQLRGPVKNITDFGLFIGLSDDVDGLVHISDVSWIRPARPLPIAYPKKTEVEAVVLNIDLENERISLGMKQLTDDLWSRALKEYGIGSRHSGPVLWVGDKGIAVELATSIEGFVSSTELPDEVQSSVLTLYPVGKKVDVVVHSLDEKERKILLGIVVDSEDSAKEKSRPKK